MGFKKSILKKEIATKELLSRYSLLGKEELLIQKIELENTVNKYIYKETNLSGWFSIIVTILLYTITFSTNSILKKIEILTKEGGLISKNDNLNLQHSLKEIQELISEHMDLANLNMLNVLIIYICIIVLYSLVKKEVFSRKEKKYMRELKCVNTIIENYDLMHKSDNTYSINKIDGKTSTNKSKIKESLYIQCINKINNKSCFVDKEDYDEADKLYLLIKEKYENEIEFNKMNIKVEKIRVEREIGKYQNESMKYSLSMIVGIIGSLIVLIIAQGIVAVSKIIPIYIATSIFVVFAILILTRQADKSLKEDKISGLENHIRLKVLEDIEKDIKESNSSFIEVASTKENKNSDK